MIACVRLMTWRNKIEIKLSMPGPLEDYLGLSLHLHTNTHVQTCTVSWTSVSQAGPAVTVGVCTHALPASGL